MYYNIILCIIIWYCVLRYNIITQYPLASPVVLLYSLTNNITRLEICIIFLYNNMINQPYIHTHTHALTHTHTIHTQTHTYTYKQTYIHTHTHTHTHSHTNYLTKFLAAMSSLRSDNVKQCVHHLSVSILFFIYLFFFKLLSIRSKPWCFNVSSVSPVFHKCFTNVTPVFHQCCTNVSPAFHQCLASVLPVFCTCFVSVSLLFSYCFVGELNWPY